MKRWTTASLLLFLLLLPTPTGLAQGTAAPRPTWTITGHETCQGGHLDVDRDISIASGGTLDLVGCRLRMASPPYEDQMMPGKDEGLAIRVDAGGLLRLSPGTDGSGAAIERADARYGYTMNVLGAIESVGTPQAWNEIRGIEGAFQAQLGLGGMRVFGDATFRYTRFIDNSGPAPFLQSVHSFVADHLEFSNASFMASRVDILHLSDVKAYGPYGATSLSLVEDARFERCDLSGILIGFYAALSNVTLAASTVQANGTGILLQHATLKADGSSIDYGILGIQSLFKTKFATRTTQVGLHDVTIHGTGPNATSALALVGTDLSVEGSRLASIRGPVVNATASRLAIHGTRLDGPTALEELDATALDLSGNVVASGAPAIVARRTTYVTVLDGPGRPFANVTVQLPGGSGITNSLGRAQVAWMLGSGATPPDLNSTAPVKVDLKTLQGKTFERTMPSNLVLVQFTVHEGTPGVGAPAPGPPLVVLAIAMCVALARRRLA